MNADYEEKGGASIIPSARRSIHSFRGETMGRYGLNRGIEKRQQRNSPNINEQDRDEVDNAMSKMAQPISPLTGRKKHFVRTNSYSETNENGDDSSDMLSKSLPSTLPSHLYYSDDDELAQNYSGSGPNTSHEDSLTLPPNLFYNDGRNQSGSSVIKSRLEDSHQSSNFSRSNFSYDHLERSYEQKSTTHNGRKGYKLNYIVIFTLCIGIFAMYYSTIIDILEINTDSYQDKSTQTVNYDKHLFENDMNNLQEKYNIDSNSILKLKSGIVTIFSKMDAGSFIFIYNSRTHNFNSQQFEQFINEVAHTAARYLRNDISSIKHTVIVSTNLDMLDHGELITRYRDDVDKSGVLLVKEVDSVPSDLAMAFHYYCDEYNPLVKRSAIFFTLDLANCSNFSDKKSTHEFIEKCLSSKWKTVPKENMRPLLTRMVDVIIDLSNVF